MFRTQQPRSSREPATPLTRAIGALGLIVVCADLAAPREAQGQMHTMVNGYAESGFPAVGGFDTEDLSAGYCTGTLIDPSWILTANHCNNMLNFMLGPDAEHATRYPLAEPGVKVTEDQQFIGPNGDIVLIHLNTPIEDVPVAEYNRGELPAIGANCTAVGFGRRNESSTPGIKRSGALIVTQADGRTIKTKLASDVIDPETVGTAGILHHGDSGGPLMCDGVVVGVARTADGSYTPVDPEWVARTMADPTHPETTVDPSESAWSPEVQLLGYSGALCPEGSMSLDAGTLSATGRVREPVSEAEAQTCTIELSVTVPAGRTFSNPVFCSDLWSEQNLPAPLRFRYAVAGGEPFETERMVFDTSHQQDACDTAFVTGPTCSAEPQTIPVTIELAADVPADNMVVLTWLNVDLTEASGAEWSSCEL